MKTLKLSNGEIRKGYEFTDLSETAQETVINNWIETECEVMDEDSPYYDYAVAAEKNQTPWFLASYIYNGERESIIETILMNDYLFDIDGDMLPVCTHYNKDGQIIKSTFGKREYLVEFI